MRSIRVNGLEQAKEEKPIVNASRKKNDLDVLPSEVTNESNFYNYNVVDGKAFGMQKDTISMSPQITFYSLALPSRQ